MQRKSILKDTIQLTVVQFFLEWVSLLLNVWLTHRIGSATVGIVALTGSFFQLAAVAANGNGFLCTSRFVSEELGKPNGNPNHVLGYAIGFCLLLGCRTAEPAIPEKCRSRRCYPHFHSDFTAGRCLFLFKRLFECCLSGGRPCHL